MPAITSRTAPSGRSRARLSCAEASQPAPPNTSRPATVSRMAVHLVRAAGLAAEPSGSASRRSVACSSGEPFRQMSTSPATVTTCGHA